MRLTEYLTDKGKYIAALLLSDLAAGVFLYLIDVRKIFIVFGMILWMIPFLIVFLLDSVNIFQIMKNVLPQHLHMNSKIK